MKTIYLVTHGPTFSNTSDPVMAPEGRNMIESLKKKLPEYLPDGPAEVFAGTGRRQWQVAQILGFTADQVIFSDIWGGAATIGDCKDVIILGHGLSINRKNYLSIQDIQPYGKKVAALPDKALICSGRPVLVRLGMREENCSSGALYALHVQDGEKVEIELLIPGVCLLEQMEQK